MASNTHFYHPNALPDDAEASKTPPSRDQSSDITTAVIRQRDSGHSSRQESAKIRNKKCRPVPKHSMNTVRQRTIKIGKPVYKVTTPTAATHRSEILKRTSARNLDRIKCSSGKNRTPYLIRHSPTNTLTNQSDAEQSKTVGGKYKRKLAGTKKVPSVTSSPVKRKGHPQKLLMMSCAKNGLKAKYDDEDKMETMSSSEYINEKKVHIETQRFTTSEHDNPRPRPFKSKIPMPAKGVLLAHARTVRSDVRGFTNLTCKLHICYFSSVVQLDYY